LFGKQLLGAEHQPTSWIIAPTFPIDTAECEAPRLWDQKAGPYNRRLNILFLKVKTTMSPSTRNLWTTLLLSLCCMVLGPVEAATLSKEDAEFLRQDIATMMTSFE
jgi:hypothetical protein